MTSRLAGRRIVVTGTGTDVGKTWVTCALVRELRAAGVPLVALKPVLSGFDATSPETSDAGRLLTALGRSVDEAGLDAVSLVRLSAPLSPDMAAAREGRSLDFENVRSWIESRLAGPSSFALVEGVGGIRSPVAAGRDALDLSKALDAAVLVVAGTYVGGLSHLFTALDSAKLAGVSVEGVVLNESEGSAATLDEALAAIRARTSGLRVATVRRNEPEPALARALGLLG